MKKIFLLIILMIGLFTPIQASQNEAGGKAAILMVHFGTTFDDTRNATIDAINQKVKEQFPDMEVREAYTSRIVIKRLKERGIEKFTPQEMLLRLAAEGYESVFVQSTNIINGIEAETLREEAEFMMPFFKDIRVGYPLLYSVEDCLEVVKIISERYAEKANGKSGVVLVGHGTSTPANAIYSQIDYMLEAENHPRFYVTTIEGYPNYDTTLIRLKKDKIRNVTLVPFMFVAGDHARNDIDGEWREALEKEGFNASALIEGLGQIPQIQDIFVDHIRQGLKERPLRPSEKKGAFLEK